MPNIVMTRIDNRLVHGQVAAQWCKRIGVNMIVVANDMTAENKFRQGLMDMAVPSFVTLRYWSIEKTIKDIHRVSDKHRVFVVVETPQDVLKLVEGGVPITKVNIGNMHMAEGKRQVAASVAVDDEDVTAFKKLKELGVCLEIRRVPSEASEDAEKIFE
jgi:PTS system N-acetylgalactosamine-specific IIB component